MIEMAGKKMRPVPIPIPIPCASIVCQNSLASDVINRLGVGQCRFRMKFEGLSLPNNVDDATGDDQMTEVALVVQHT